jgi:hypothetical protein
MKDLENEVIFMRSQIEYLQSVLLSMQNESAIAPYTVGHGADDLYGVDYTMIRGIGKIATNIIAFGCTNSGLVVTVKLGKVYFKGVSKTITDWPTDGEVTLTDTTFGYIEISLSAGTATWKTSATDPGDGDDDTEIWRIFGATVASGAITELLECQHGDIHCLGNA